MGLLSNIFRSKEPISDDGALYRRIEPGAPIQFDDEEKVAVEKAIHENQQEDRKFLDLLHEEGINVSVVEDSYREIEHDTKLGVAAGALMQVAYERYQNHEYSAAAETCLKALGFLGNRDDPNENTAEVWLLLSRIHASAGRFQAAFSLLKEAKRSFAKDTSVNYKHNRYLISGRGLWSQWKWPIFPP